VVDEVAQGTDSHQMARGLLLEEGAEIFHKPELEIYADDVKCGHGATIASLDPTQMFYLQSRGIPAVQARDMLLEAFVQQVTDHAPDALRDNLEAWARRNLLQKEGSA
jgi:Fe-S cluster assembly protein SufD